MLLPDTSVWIAYFRAGADRLTRELTAALDDREILTCGPVVAELVAGARPPERDVLVASLAGLPWVELDRKAWVRVGRLAADLRERGPKLPLTDLEIAVCAQSAGAVLWSADRDFERLADALDGLELRRA